MSCSNYSFKLIREVKQGPRLIIFPYAGAGAYSTVRWLSELPEEVEVCALQRAGREDRFDEPAQSSLLTYLAESGAALSAQLDNRPYFLFGHSLGGFLAYQTAAWIADHGLPPPKALFISGITPLICPENHALARMEQARFINTAFENNSTRTSDIKEELLEKATEAYRNDLRLYFEAESDAIWPILNIPIVAFYGSRDNIAPRDGVLAWSHYSQAGFSLHEINGEHMFVETSGRHQVLMMINQTIKNIAFTTPTYPP